MGSCLPSWRPSTSPWRLRSSFIVGSCDLLCATLILFSSELLHFSLQVCLCVLRTFHHLLICFFNIFSTFLSRTVSRYYCLFQMCCLSQLANFRVPDVHKGCALFQILFIYYSPYIQMICSKPKQNLQMKR